MQIFILGFYFILFIYFFNRLTPGLNQTPYLASSQEVLEHRYCRQMS